MNRADFMRRLSELLADVSPAERDEAIQYYNDYFDDAGAENEQSVIASLGSPEQLAGTIKTGLADGGNTGEFTEKGFYGYEQKRNDEVMDISKSSGAENKRESEQQKEFQGRDNGRQQNQGNADWQQNNAQNGNSGSRNNNRKPMSGGAIALIVILCICASPILLGVACALFGIIIGIFASLFGIVVGIGAAAISLLIVGVCLFAYGIVLLFSLPLGGLALMGVGMICAAVGLFFLWLTVMICGMLIPLVIRGIVKLFNNIFNRGGATA
ncbi:MAG: hypothetical protein J1E98_15110 [Lachnospiraceae bacterium]|nr:hypothetical protein [Lachnospiraceae bacterium]